jgi:hypothetical protein
MKVSTAVSPLDQRISPRLVAVALLIGAVSAAQAAYLVDTGLPDIGTVKLRNVDTTKPQHLGASFNIASDSTITSLGAYMYNSGSGSVTYELHQGGPTGSLVYSGTVASVGVADYYTLSDLNLAVGSGLYTLNFIASYGFNGGMNSGAPGLPDALTATYFSNDTTNWKSAGGATFGIQVGGTAGGATGVPAPLPLLGVVGAFAWSRKLRSRIQRASQHS